MLKGTEELVRRMASLQLLLFSKLDLMLVVTLPDC